jgi:drug/metabolite transporter (DMT)-like permease
VHRRPAIVLAAVAILWGTVPVMVRWTGLPTAVIVGGRVWLAALTLGIVLLVRRSYGDRGRLFPVLPAIAVLSGVLLAAHWLALISAVKQAPVGTVLLITYLAPVVVALVARPVLGEHVPPTTFVALGVALAGTVLLLEPWEGASLDRGIAMAALAAITYAGLTLCSKRVAFAYGGLRLAFVQMVVAGIVVLPSAASESWGESSASWLWLVVLGVVAAGVMAAIYLACLARLPVATAGVLMYLEPMSAVAFGWWLLDESPSGGTLVGGAMVVVAGVVVARATARVPSAVTEPAHVSG